MTASSSVPSLAPAKPIVKWVGGKYALAQSTLIPKLSMFPMEKYDTYVEPFLGGGGMLFSMLEAYPHLTNVYASDLNAELVNLYIQIRDNVEAVKQEFDAVETSYNSLASLDEKKAEYLELRVEYNESIRLSRLGDFDKVRQAALFVALNKLGFNGLYRVNSKGFFNAHFGNKEVGKLYDEQNLYRVSEMLSRVILNCADYQDSLQYASPSTFYYFDSPYRPVSTSASFSRYTLGGFNDDDQRELAAFCGQVAEAGSGFMLSNSNPKDLNEEDSFFDDLYSNYGMDVIPVRRRVGAQAHTRKMVTEILVTHF